MGGFTASNHLKKVETYCIIFTKSDPVVLNYMKDFKARAFTESGEFPV